MTRISTNLLNALNPVEQVAPAQIAGAEANIDRLNSLADQAGRLKASYKTPEAAYNAFVDSTKDFTMDDSTREGYWSVRRDMYPGSDVDFQTSVMDEVELELSSRPNDLDREFYLRDALTRLPDFAQDKYVGELAQLQTNSNTRASVHSTAQFRDELNNRTFKAFNEMDLDVNLPTETHGNDYLRVEALDLVPNMTTQNGRIGVMSNGTFVPGGDIESREALGFSPNDIFEQRNVTREAHDIVFKNMDSALSLRRRQSVNDTTVANMSIMKRLEDGDIAPKEWFRAVGSMNVPQGSESDAIVKTFKAGVRGQYINPNQPLRSFEDGVNFVASYLGDLTAFAPEDNL